jgi:hypothetical protein
MRDVRIRHVSGKLCSNHNVYGSKACFFSQPTQAAWRLVFFSTCGVYLACGLFYFLCASGKRQPWDGDARGAQEEKDDDEVEPRQDNTELHIVK